MSFDALRAGLGGDWPFETFPEYLDAIERRGVAINVAALRRPHAGAALRDGRGGHRARRHAGRDRAHARDRARGARRRRRRPRHLEIAHPRRLRRPAGAEPARRARRDPRARGRARRGRQRHHAGHPRARPLLRRVRPDRRRDGPPDLVDGAARRRDGARVAPRRARARRAAAARGAHGDSAGLLPAAQLRVPVEGALPLREHEGLRADLARRPRGQAAHLPRPRVPPRVPREHRDRLRSRAQRPGGSAPGSRACPPSRVSRSARSPRSPASAACTRSISCSTSASRPSSRRASASRS